MSIEKLPTGTSVSCTRSSSRLSVSGPTRLDVAGLRFEHIDTFDLNPNLVRADLLDRNVRLAEDDEQVAGAGVLQFAGHVQIRVHPRLQDRDAADAVEFRRASIEVKGAGDHHIEPGGGRLTRGVDKVRARDDTKFRADQDRSPALS